MDLFEFQAKELFGEYGVPVPQGRVARTPVGPGQGHLPGAARALVADAPEAPELGGSR